MLPSQLDEAAKIKQQERTDAQDIGPDTGFLPQMNWFSSSEERSIKSWVEIMLREDSRTLTDGRGRACANDEVLMRMGVDSSMIDTRNR